MFVSTIWSLHKMFHKELCFTIFQKCTRCSSSLLVQLSLSISVVLISDFDALVFGHYYNLVRISPEAHSGLMIFVLFTLITKLFGFCLDANFCTSCAQLFASLCQPTLSFGCLLRSPRQITGDSHLPQTNYCLSCSSEI